MYNKKNLGIIFIFALIILSVIMLALTKFKITEVKYNYQEEKSVEISRFENVHYFKLKNALKSIELSSNELVITDNIFMNFSSPKGQVYSGSRVINYTSDKGVMNQVTKNLNLIGNVIVTDGVSEYTSDNINYEGKADILRANGNVKTKYVDAKTNDTILLKSNSMSSNLTQKMMILEGSVTGELIRKRQYEGGLNFSAETVVLNSLESNMTLSNNVKLHRNNYYLSAQNAQVFLENFNKKLKYYTLYDDVKLEETIMLRSGKSQMRRAYAEKLEAHQRSGKIILTGAPRVEQGDDVIKGYQITLRDNVEMVEVDDSQTSFSLKKDRN